LQGSLAPVRVTAADPALRARIEQSLAAQAPCPVIVTSDLGGLAALRVANPGAGVVIVAVRRSQIPAALDAGADVALAGELRPAELQAHIRALARRSQARPDDTRWSVGPLVLDPAARTVALDGARLELPRREFALLCCLASQPGRVLTKAELLRTCWEDGACTPGSRTLERHTARLRRRLGRYAPILVTVWGVGYRLDAAG
jgi:DNA-binding response OmpR family regulator